MTLEDPPRLVDAADPGAPSFLRDALAAAQGDGPSADQIARLAARLPLGGPPPAPPSPPPGAGGAITAAPPSVLSGALIGAALGALVAGAGLVWDGRRDPGTSTPSPVRPPVSEVSPRAEAARPAEKPAPPPAAVRGGAEGRSAPVRASAEPAAPTTAAPAPPDPVASAEPVAQTEPAAATGGAGSIAPREGLRSEVELLQRARDALAGSPAQALALTQEHATLFPGGALAQEREVLAIDALSRLGRGGEARARGGRFLAAFPGSAHRRRIEAIVGP